MPTSLEILRMGIKPKRLGENNKDKRCLDIDKLIERNRKKYDKENK